VAFAQQLTAMTQEVSRWRGLADARHLYPAVIALIVAACAMLPVMLQDPSYHGFADQRQWLGIPNAADVLSNLAFALVGVMGIARLASRGRPRFSPATESGLWCIAVGIVATAVGSTWYHLDPSNASLFWDRLPMTLVLAGVLGAALAQRIPGHPGRWGLPLFVALGIASVLYWKVTGNLSLYVMLQSGGIVTLLVLIVATRSAGDPIPWAWVLAWYALAKVAEAADLRIWDATDGMIAGHALKHLLAAAAIAAVLWPLFTRRGLPGELASRKQQR